jgi:cytidyltransferase-like protein
VILTGEALVRHRGKVAMVDGCFDPLHHGHVEYFRAAAALGAPVFCNIASDEYLRRKKHPPLLSETARAQVIDALRFVSFTHINITSTAAVLDELAPRYYVKGRDWEGRLPLNEIAACERHGIELIYVDTVRDSSSRLLQDYLARAKT